MIKENTTYDYFDSIVFTVIPTTEVWNSLNEYGWDELQKTEIGWSSVEVRRTAKRCHNILRSYYYGLF